MTSFNGPFNYLELLNSMSLPIIADSWDFGEYTFTTTFNKTKTVTGVRIYLSQSKGPNMYRGLPYVDIGQQKLLYQLRPLLEGVVPHIHEITITAYGVRPRTEYSVSIRALA